MHKYIILFFSVLLVLIACDTDKTPAGIIAKPQMIRLLTDIHIVDGELSNIPQDKDSLYKYGASKYGVVFKKYHTNSSLFKKSFQYYTTQPEVIEDIYNQVSDNIKSKTDSLNKIGTKKSPKNAIP
ncbi:DUF4296 domain-containing protein [Inquilinus sp. KBS0705]|nr:DUF4296 domain-containing protein [Inquilinus sp. KBS0705]